MSTSGCLVPVSTREGGGGTEFGNECVSFFGEMAHAVGVPRSVGQIYGLLYGSPEPLSFTDVAARLDISRGSASQGLQLLRSLGAVASAGVKEERREYFGPEMGLRKLLRGLLRERLEPAVEVGARRFARLQRLAERADTHREFQLQRIRQIKAWRTQLKFGLPVLRAFLGPRAS